MSVAKIVSGRVIEKGSRAKEVLNRGTYSANVTVTGFVKRGGHKYDVDYHVEGDVVVAASPERTKTVIDPEILASYLLPYLTAAQASEVSRTLGRKAQTAIGGKIEKNAAGAGAASALLTIIKTAAPKVQPADSVTAIVKS